MGEDRRAEPGYYVAYFTRTGEADGLLDQRWSEVQVRTLREAELEEHARQLSGLMDRAQVTATRNAEEDEDHTSPSVANGTRESNQDSPLDRPGTVQPSY